VTGGDLWWHLTSLALATMAHALRRLSRSFLAILLGHSSLLSRVWGLAPLVKKWGEANPNPQEIRGQRTPKVRFCQDARNWNLECGI